MSTVRHKHLSAESYHSEAPTSLTVRLGDWDLATTHEPLAHQSREVDRCIVHPRYNNRTLSHDVALVILKVKMMGRTKVHYNNWTRSHNVALVILELKIIVITKVQRITGRCMASARFALLTSLNTTAIINLLQLS